MPGFSVEPEALCNRRSVPSSEARPDQGQTAYNAERYTPYDSCYSAMWMGR